MPEAAGDHITPLGMFLRAHWLGILMVAVGALPGFNHLYSGHGGLAWFILFAVFPLAACTYAATYWLAPQAALPALRYSMKRSLLAYALFSLSGSFLVSFSVQASYGLQIAPLQLWGMFFFPINFVLDPSVFG